MIKLKSLLMERPKIPKREPDKGFVPDRKAPPEPRGLMGQTPSYWIVNRPTVTIRTPYGKQVKARKGAFIYHLKDGTFYVDPKSQIAVELENRNKNFKGMDSDTWPLYKLQYTGGELKQIRSAPMRDSEWKAWLKK